MRDLSLLSIHPERDTFWAEATDLNRYFYVLARKVSGTTHRERMNKNQLAKYESYNFKDDERREMYREDLVNECILSYIESRSRGRSVDQSKHYSINGAHHMWDKITDRYRTSEVQLSSDFDIEDVQEDDLTDLKDQIVANLSEPERKMLDAFMNNEHDNGKPNWGAMDQEMGFSLRNGKSKIAMESLKPKMLQAFFA